MSTILRAAPFDAEEIIDPDTGQTVYDRTSDAKDLSDLLRAFFSNGILVQGTDLLTNQLQVLHLSGMSCVVKPGDIIINGRIGLLDTQTTLNFDVGTANPRIDRAIVELNISDRNIVVKLLKGTPSASPSAPALTQTEDIFQIPLAQIRVNANQSVIASVTDERAGYISNVLLNQAPSEDITAVTVGISEALRVLYGLSVDNANVDKALQQSWNHGTQEYIVETIDTSRNWTIPSYVREIDILAISGGTGGASGLATKYFNNYAQTGGVGGASGGAIAINKVKVVPNDILSIIIGAGGIGGVSAVNTGSTEYVYGNVGTVGGLTSITGKGVDLKVSAAYSGSTSWDNADIATNFVGNGTVNYKAIRGLTGVGPKAGSTLYLPFGLERHVSSAGNGGTITGTGSYDTTAGVGGIGAGNGGKGAFINGNPGADATEYGCGGGGGGASEPPHNNGGVIVTSGRGGNGKQGVVYIGYWRNKV